MSMTKIVAVTENLKTKVQDLLMQTDRLRAIYADEKLMMEQSGLTQEQLDLLTAVPNMDIASLTEEFAKGLLSQFKGNEAYPSYVLGKAFWKNHSECGLRLPGIYLKKSHRKEIRLCTLDLLTQLNRRYSEISYDEDSLQKALEFSKTFQTRFTKLFSHS
ncbi:hypothetical protein HOH87_01910 [bacterium]|jgi:hypothetical protein|nr:hypothetical protein [bacterium]